MVIQDMFNFFYVSFFSLQYLETLYQNVLLPTVGWHCPLIFKQYLLQTYSMHHKILPIW